VGAREPVSPPAPRGGALTAALAVALALVLFLPGLDRAPFDDPGEGQHAEIAREAWQSGDFVTLRLNGVRYFDKPPLLYLMQAVAFSVSGVSERAARAVPLAGAALAAAGVAVLGTRLLGPGGGLLAAAALLSSALFAAFARYVRPETLFLAAIQWGMTGLLLGWRERSRRWTLLGCASLGLAALAKDPFGLVAPLAAVALALALGGRLRPVSAWLPPLGWALLLVVGGGWYALGTLRNGDAYLWYVFVDNHARNAALMRLYPDEDVPISAVEFAATTALGAFPWIIPAALSAVAMVRRRAWRDPAEAPWVALTIWAAGVVALFTLLPFRLPHYGLPAYPAFALLAARWWRERRVAGGRAAAGLHAALLGLAALACLLGARSDGRFFTDVVLGVSDVTTRKATTIASGVTLHPLWLSFASLLGFAGLVLAAGAALLGWLALRRRAGAAVVAMAMLLTVTAVGSALGALSASRAVAGLAQTVAGLVRPGDRLVHEGPIEASGALELYSGHRPALLEGRRSVLGFGATFPEAADTFWSRERFRREWLGEGTVYLVTPRAPDRSVMAEMPPARRRLVSEDNGRRLYVNTPQVSR
jgi:4-amino-4-deoxy-L-arabinose transferase-like glycosyltransferase